LLKGDLVSLEETAAAVADEPSNTTFRITHALNLLKKNRPAEALEVFDDVTVFADRLSPGQQAVIAAVLLGSGDEARARVGAGARCRQVGTGGIRAHRSAAGVGSLSGFVRAAPRLPGTS
jgi:hypothetical protein